MANVPTNITRRTPEANYLIRPQIIHDCFLGMTRTLHKLLARPKRPGRRHCTVAIDCDPIRPRSTLRIKDAYHGCRAVLVRMRVIIPRSLKFLGSSPSSYSVTLCGSARIVHQDRRGACQHIVRVEFSDCEVVTVGCARRLADRGDVDLESVLGGERVAGLELSCRYPGVCGLVPEGVFRGGVESGGVSVGGANGQVDQVVVVVDPRGGDGVRALVFAGFGVSGLNLVAGLDITDRLGLALVHQDRCIGGETAGGLGTACTGGRLAGFCC